MTYKYRDSVKGYSEFEILILAILEVTARINIKPETPISKVLRTLVRLNKV